MKKHISKAAFLILSSLLLLTALTACDNDSNINHKESQPLVIFDKEYDEVIDFLRGYGGNLDVIPVQIAECFFFGERERLKQYYEKEEDWVHDIEYIIDDGLLANAYRFSLDNRFILTGTDDQGRNTISLNVGVYGDYHDREPEDVLPNPGACYIRVSLVHANEGEWLATGVGKL